MRVVGSGAFRDIAHTAAVENQNQPSGLIFHSRTHVKEGRQEGVRGPLICNLRIFNQLRPQTYKSHLPEPCPHLPHLPHLSTPARAYHSCPRLPEPVHTCPRLPAPAITAHSCPRLPRLPHLPKPVIAECIQIQAVERPNRVCCHGKHPNARFQESL